MNEIFCTRVKQTLSYRLQSTEVWYLVTCRHKPHSKAKTPGVREHVCLKFNAGKCMVMHCGCTNPRRSYSTKQTDGSERTLDKTYVEKEFS